MEKLKAMMAISDGFEPKLCGWIFDEMTALDKFGQVFCDEMKLKAFTMCATKIRKNQHQQRMKQD